MDSVFFSKQCFYDVGANIGVYTLYSAAINPTIRVVALEPNLNNFRHLVTNIQLNNFSAIYPLPLAVGELSHPEQLFVHDNQFGATGAQVASPIDEHNNQFKQSAEYAVLTISLADLIQTYPDLAPNYIKVDIDGQEAKVIRGIDLANSSLRSILVEISHTSSDATAIKAHMARFNFFEDLYYKNLPEHSSKRRGGNPENVVFTRNHSL